MYFKIIYTLREFPPKPVHTFEPILSLISDLILYFIQNSNGVDFCETFKKKGFGIDYGFGGNTNPGFPPKGFLIMDQYLWKVDVDIDREELRFLSKEGNESQSLQKRL